MVEEYVCLRIAFTPESYLLLVGLLSAFPLSGVEEHEGRMTVFISKAAWENVRDDFSCILQQHGFRWQQLPSAEVADWYRMWVEQLQPVWIAEGVVVHPFPRPPQPGQYPTAREVLHIVPGTAFGTGHHASTRLAARLLLQHLRPSTVWLDAGTGSGILAILAAHCGARRVYAVDNNPFAIEQARHNIAQNHAQDRVTLIHGDIESIAPPPVHGITANLHTELLMRLASRFARWVEPGGICIVSGVLESTSAELLEVFENAQFRLETKQSEMEWVAFALRKT